MLQQTIYQMALSLPPDLRKKFKGLMISNIDIPALEKVIKDGMIKHFTAEELKSLADSDASLIGESLAKKYDAYMLEVMPDVEAKMGEALAKALAKASPKIVEAILNDGRLGIRVKNRYSAIAENNAKTQYDMVPPAIRRNMTFEEWKKYAGLDQTQQQSAQKVVQGELEKICYCGPSMYENGSQTLRCTLFVRVTTEDGGHRKPNRLFQMWESVDGEWYHGYTDHHELEDCPKYD
jgi:hypothetical protein